MPNTVSERQKCKIPCNIPRLQGNCVETGAVAVDLRRFGPLDGGVVCDVYSSSRSRQGNIEFAKSILSNECSIGWRGKGIKGVGVVAVPQRIGIKGEKRWT